MMKTPMPRKSRPRMMCSTVEPVSLTPTGEPPSAVRALRSATLTLAGMGNVGAGLGGIALEDDMAAAAGSVPAAAGAARSLAGVGALIAASDAAIAFCSGVCWSELTFSPRVLACCCCMLATAGCVAVAGASVAARAAMLLPLVGAAIAASDAAIALWSCGDRWSELTFLPRASVSSKPSARLPGASFAPSATGVAAQSKPSSIATAFPKRRGGRTS